jgi:hypothetical protein
VRLPSKYQLWRLNELGLLEMRRERGKPIDAGTALTTLSDAVDRGWWTRNIPRPRSSYQRLRRLTRRRRRTAKRPTSPAKLDSFSRVAVAPANADDLVADLAAALVRSAEDAGA